jgi:hypothetical protein
MIQLYDEQTLSHVTIIPEPSTFLLASIAMLTCRRGYQDRTKRHRR